MNDNIIDEVMLEQYTESLINNYDCKHECVLKMRNLENLNKTLKLQNARLRERIEVIKTICKNM